MRQYVEVNKTKIIGLNNSPTDRPTSHMITRTFHCIIVINTGDGRRLARPLSDAQQDYLKALAVSAAIFTMPDPSGQLLAAGLQTSTEK